MPQITCRPYRETEDYEDTRFYKHPEETPQQINPTGLRKYITESFSLRGTFC